MILFLIPLAGIFLGLGLWVALRGLGLLNVLGAESRGRVARQPREPWQRGSATTVRERIDQIPQGLLIAVTVLAGLWILGWLIVLIVGLSYLS